MRVPRKGCSQFFVSTFFFTVARELVRHSKISEDFDNISTQEGERQYSGGEQLSKVFLKFKTVRSIE